MHIERPLQLLRVENKNQNVKVNAGVNVGVRVWVRVGVGVEKIVGWSVAEIPIRVIVWGGLKVPNIDPNAH